MQISDFFKWGCLFTLRGQFYGAPGLAEFETECHGRATGESVNGTRGLLCKGRPLSPLQVSFITLKEAQFKE